MTTQKQLEQMVREVKKKYSSRVRNITPSEQRDFICYVVKNDSGEEELKAYKGDLGEPSEVTIYDDEKTIQRFPQNLSYLGQTKWPCAGHTHEIRLLRPGCETTANLDWGRSTTSAYMWESLGTGTGLLPFG